MDIRPYNGFAANDDSDTLSGIGRSGSTLSSSPRDLRDDQMDQIAMSYAVRGRELGIEVVTSHEGMSLPIGAGS